MESDRYLFIHLDDLIIQPEETAAMIMRACKRSTPFQVQALCQHDDELLLVLSECPSNKVPDDVRWLDVSEIPFRDLAALLVERWQAGYEPVGSITSSSEYDPRKRFLLVQRPSDFNSQKNKKN